MLKQQIERADVDKIKCFNFDCDEAVSKKKIESIMKVHNVGGDLLEKYERFKEKKANDSDPLIRWCTKPGCDTTIRAENTDATKLTCPTCSTEVCYQCKEPWHGEDVTCDEAIEQQMEGWAEETRVNIQACPLCKSKIEKNKGCNHMTCAFCEYEFCWGCGKSATQADRHFEPGRGCGVEMMDESIRPGDRGNRGCSLLKVLKYTGLGILAIIGYPFALVFGFPGYIGYVFYKNSAERNGCVRILAAILGVFLGLLLNAIFIPFAIIITLGFLANWPLNYCCTYCCITDDNVGEEENRRRA